MTASGTFTTTARPHPARHTALDPYIRRIRTEVMRSAGKSRGRASLRLRIGSRALDLESWILESLLESSVAPPDGSPGGLLVQAVAFATKCLHDTETLVTSDARDVHRVRALQAELTLDVALGTALVREMQSRIEVVVHEGRVDHAKDWNRLRQTVSDIVSASKQLLTEGELRGAEQLSWEFSGRSPADGAASPEASFEVPTIPLKRPAASDTTIPLPKNLRTAPSRRPNSHESDREADGAPADASESASALAIAVVIAVVGIGLLAFGPSGGSAASPGPSAAQLPGASRIASFEPRVMSASIVVREDAWSTLDERAKLGWVNDLGRSLAKSGNEGLLLRTTSGRPVATWLASRGASLLDARDVSSPPVPGKASGRQ